MNEAQIKNSSPLYKLMKSKNLSLRALARDTKIPLTSLHSHFSGKGSLNSAYLIKLSVYFDCSLDYLLTGKEHKSKQVRDISTSMKNQAELSTLFEGWVKIKVESKIKKAAEFAAFNFNYED